MITSYEVSMTANLMTIEDFGKRNRLSRSKVYGMVRAGELKLTKIGKSTRISAAEETRWLRSIGALPPESPVTVH
ncbi:MAG: helix-turn-helix domain-containing protein [Ancalomicrobiaceae bacterium]|nr:helix-turn-helix domain-containing protein [Ancalomicrobiaceae bacterium]